jgi:hypothetical protein
MSKTVSASAQTDKAMQVYNNFDVDNAYVKPKHLEAAKAGNRRFLGNKVQAESALKEAMRARNIVSYGYEGVTQMGNPSYNYILQAGRIIGAKGETHIFIILSSDGGMLTAFPTAI